MSSIRMMVRNFIKNDEAATMVEYGLMLALIAVVCVVAIAAIGTDLNAKFEFIRDQIK